MKKYLLILALLAFFPVAEADVYKCKTPDGKTEYKNLPCSNGATTQSVHRDNWVSREEYEAAARVAQRERAHLNSTESQNGTQSASCGGRLVCRRR